MDTTSSYQYGKGPEKEGGCLCIQRKSDDMLARPRLRVLSNTAIGLKISTPYSLCDKRGELF